MNRQHYRGYLVGCGAATVYGVLLLPVCCCLCPWGARTPCGQELLPPHGLASVSEAAAQDEGSPFSTGFPRGPAPAWHPTLLPLIQQQQCRVAGGSLGVGLECTGCQPRPHGPSNSHVTVNISCSHMTISFHVCTTPLSICLA